MYFIKDSDMSPTLQHHNERLLEDGFVATGHLREGRQGQYRRFRPLHKFYGAAQRRNRNNDGISCSAAASRGNCPSRRLSYHLPNDIFNDKIRDVYSAGDAP